MKSELEQAIATAVSKLTGKPVEAELNRPEEQFGDYSTNVALQLSKEIGKPPRQIADELADKLRADLKGQVSEISVANAGFLNIKLSDSSLVAAAQAEPKRMFVNQEVLVEFGDPNPFKEMHLGHLYAAIVGDTIARLFEVSGAKVRRLSYHGDVGMHVAKAIWAMLNDPSLKTTQATKFTPEILSALKNNMGVYYAEGAKAFEADEKHAEEIKKLNEQIYEGQDEQLNSIYLWGRERSFSQFQFIFGGLGIEYDKQYLESESSPIGVELVRKNIGKVFEASEGAIVYRGEKAGLHTRVFLNSRGLPTYETKDLGLAVLKDRDFPKASQSVIVTANEQTEYFKVMLAALHEIDDSLASKTKHISHGFLSLTTGKMSSRTGEVAHAIDLMESVRQAARQQFGDSAAEEDIYLAALKYTFLKNRIGGDITFDIKESVALEGNSGPYLQYAHARAKSILDKSKGRSQLSADIKLEAGERSLLRKISEYPEVVDRATNELMPHHIATYLYELAQIFNRFYEANRVIGDKREALRLALVDRYAETLRKGLNLLGVAAPDKM